MNDLFLETPRLWVKIPTLADLPAYTQLLTDAEVMRYIGVRTAAGARKSLSNMMLHYKRHGFTLGMVYEKATGLFVGRAGLVYLEMDASQAEIEIGYALLQDFWGKGYGVELTKACLNWGFQHLTLTQLIAVISPENERSRRVLEKSGLYYVGKIHCYDSEVAKYAIDKPAVDYQQIRLTPAMLADYPVMQNLMRFYAYDMSAYLGKNPGWEMPASGLYDGIDLKKYWEADHVYPFLIHYANELAGFVIIDKKGSQPQTDFNMAQFFILRKFSGQGIGRHVAYRCFGQFPGRWEVMVLPGNEGAYRFWRTVIKAYTGQPLQEYTQAIAHFNQHISNIFRFNSQRKDRYSSPPGYDLKQDQVELVPYCAQWPEDARREIQALRTLLPQEFILDIQHVGSTAIPGMPAKPVIDIQIAATSLPLIKPLAIELLQSLDYVYWAENPDPERMFFVKGMPPYGKRRSHHLHIVEPLSRHWQEKLLFRDYLREHIEAANAYALLKQKLATQYREDRETYTDAKTKFVHEILRRARRASSSKELIISHSSPAEKQYVDEQIVAYNASQVKFTQENPFIAIDYCLKDAGGKLLGGINAVLYCWGCLAINTLWIDPDYRGQGYGSLLLNQVEQQAQQSACRIAQVDTFDFQGREFYLANGYVIFAELHHCPPGHTRFYLVKSL